MSRMNIASNIPGADNIVPLPLTRKERRRAADKWTAQVIAHGYTPLPSLLLKAQAKLKLTPVQLNVLLHVIEPWWDADRLPWIAKDTIAQRMRKTPRSIQRVITQLEKAGHLKRVERYYGRKHQTANAFDLSGLAKKLLQFEPEFRKAKEQNWLRKKKVEAA